MTHAHGYFFGMAKFDLLRVNAPSKYPSFFFTVRVGTGGKREDLIPQFYQPLNTVSNNLGEEEGAIVQAIKLTKAWLVP